MKFLVALLALIFLAGNALVGYLFFKEALTDKMVHKGFILQSLPLLGGVVLILFCLPVLWHVFRLLTTRLRDPLRIDAAYSKVMMLLLTTSSAFLLVVFSTACGSSSRGPVATGATPSAGQIQLSTVADVQLPGDTSRWDYQAIDPQSHRLFIAHLGAGEVVVYDTQRAA